RGQNEQESNHDVLVSALGSWRPLDNLRQRDEPAEQVGARHDVRQEVNLYPRVRVRGFAWFGWFGRRWLHAGSLERGEQRLAHLHVIPQLHVNLCVERQVDVDPRAELNQADEFAAAHRFAGLRPDIDAPGDEAGDEAHGELAVRQLARRKTEQDILIELAAIGFGGAEEPSFLVFAVSQLSRDRRALHVNIDDG